MKNIIILLLIAILSGCIEYDLNTVKNGIVVEKCDNSILIVRSKGHLVNVKVGKYEFEHYQLGDTIK